jgi:hypothetical protein
MISVSVSEEKACAQLQVVLDDAVVDHRHPLEGVGVGVLVGGAAVGGPAGVADAGGARHRLDREAGDEVLQLPLGPHHLEPARPDGGDARRVVATVLEPCKPAEQHVSRAAGADVSDDSTHR